jgi:hypothetical protein
LRLASTTGRRLPSPLELAQWAQRTALLPDAESSDDAEENTPRVDASARAAWLGELRA